MIEYRTLERIAELIDFAERLRHTVTAQNSRKLVALLDWLAEDLVGRHSTPALASKLRVRRLVDELCPGRELA